MFKLKEYKDREFKIPMISSDLIDKVSIKVKDKGYLNFITEVSNGGFFFDGALQIYGVCKSPPYHNIEYINEIIHYEYGDLSSGLYFFGQEALGNQFAFASDGIAMFNVETADIEILCEDFTAWVDLLFNDLDYLSARGLLIEWRKEKSFSLDQRLCAKKPFVIGGEYKLDNLYAQFFPTYLSSNANIAKQIHNLPDGTEVRIDIVD